MTLKIPVVALSCIRFDTLLLTAFYVLLIGLLKIRGAIRLIRGSGQRIDEFERRIKEGNSFKFWGSRKDGTPITITPAKLLLDVRTRWDSTYQMLERFYDMKGVCYIF